MATFDLQKIGAFWRALHGNPADVMQQLPPKYDAAGNEIAVASPANAEDAATSNWNQGRDQLRSKVIGEKASTRAAYAANDNPRDLVDSFVHETLPGIEAAGLKAARLETHPWSGDYWATASGGLANRYVGCMPGGWKEGFDYIRNHPSKIITVRPISTDNLTLTFFPCEIKALGSLLWAKSNPKTRLIGGCCNTEKPAFDPATGRVVTLMNPFVAADYPTDQLPDPTQPAPGAVDVSLGIETWDEATGVPGAREGGRPTAADCADSNPGSWHLAVVNQIGVSKRSMVLDASFDPFGSHRGAVV